MNLTEIFSAIKEESLSRGQLENYEQDLASVYAEMMMSIATLKKARALFLYSRGQEHPELPAVKIKMTWDATDEGLKLIELESQVKAVSRILSSVKSRIYQSY
jgi:hypothetical protein